MITNTNMEFRLVLGVDRSITTVDDRNKLLLEVAATIEETLRKAYPTQVHVLETSQAVADVVIDRAGQHQRYYAAVGNLQPGEELDLAKLQELRVVPAPYENL